MNRGVERLAVVVAMTLGGLLTPAGSVVPADAAQTIQSRIIDVIDGDTIRVHMLGSPPRRTYLVDLIGIDAPETSRDGTVVECGGPGATHSALSLSFSKPRDTNGDGLFDRRGGRGRRLLLATDPSQGLRDLGRLLAYAKLRGGPDLATAQLRGGWAKVHVVRKRFRRYGAFVRSERTARRQERGVWGMCGGRFHRPVIDGEPVPEPPPPPPLPPPPPPSTPPPPPPPPPPGPACDPSYPTVCIPPPLPDLDCSQISPRNFAVVGSDPHGFDSDGDGVGCET